MGLKIWSVQKCFYSTAKKADTFSSRKVVHDVELIEHEFFCCFGVLHKLLKTSSPPLPPQNQLVDTESKNRSREPLGSGKNLTTNYDAVT